MKQPAPSKYPESWPTVEVPLDPKDLDWIKELGGTFSLVDGIHALISLYRQGKRPVVEANGSVVHRVKRPIYQGEE